MQLLLLFGLCWIAPRIIQWLLPRRVLQLSVYFGVPGAGKTTFAAYLVRQAAKESRIVKFCRVHESGRVCRWVLASGLLKRSVPVWSNVPIRGAYQIDVKEDLGKYQIEDGSLIIDEAGIDFNSRQYKSLPMSIIKWLKLHRHYRMSVDVLSQSHEDMDITLRRLAQRYFLVKKSLLPNFICLRRIYRKVGIDATTHQLCDWYYFGLPIIDSQYIYAPPLWSMFDSFAAPELERKDWQRWYADDAAAGLEPEPESDVGTEPEPTPTRERIRILPWWRRKSIISQ